MALKRLKTDEMIQLSAAWVSGGAAHASIATVPELTGLVRRIEEVRSSLIALQPQAADPKIAALSQEAAEVDLRHDAIARGIHTTLSGFAMLAADAAAGIEGEVDAQVFGALRIAERNADRRGRSRGGEEPAPAPDGSPTA